jgi:hypothetical protein
MSVWRLLIRSFIHKKIKGKRKVIFVKKNPFHQFLLIGLKKLLISYQRIIPLFVSLFSLQMLISFAKMKENYGNSNQELKNVI